MKPYFQILICALAIGILSCKPDSTPNPIPEADEPFPAWLPENVALDKELQRSLVAIEKSLPSSQKKDFGEFLEAYRNFTCEQQYLRWWNPRTNRPGRSPNIFHTCIATETRRQTSYFQATYPAPASTDLVGIFLEARGGMLKIHRTTTGYSFDIHAVSHVTSDSIKGTVTSTNVRTFTWIGTVSDQLCKLEGTLSGSTIQITESGRCSNNNEISFSGNYNRSR